MLANANIAMMTPQAIRGKGREALLAEALRLFASRGVEAVSVRDIAASTGFSNPALFRHFSSKEALAEALFEQCYRRLVTALGGARGQPFHAWLAAALAEIERSPEGVLFVLDNLKRYFATLPADLAARPLPRIAIEMIEEQQQAGRMRSDIATRLIATVIFGTLGQIARSVHFHETTIDAEELGRNLAELLTGGLSPLPTTSLQGASDATD